MATVDRTKVCTECLTNPKRQRKGKKFPLCDDCRKIVTARRWKTRSLKRTLKEGSLIQFHQGDGWRGAYLLKLCDVRADIQPIGAIGKIPDVISINIVNIKAEPNPSKLWPTVDDFYRANKRTAPVVLVADPTATNKNVTRVQKVAVFTKREQPKPVNSSKPLTEKKARAPKVNDVERTAKDAEVYALKNSTKLTYTQLDLQVFSRVTHGNLSWAAYKRESARVAAAKG
jgi:hypothetical protein